MTGVASRFWFQEETKILYLPSQLDGPCSSSSPTFSGWMSKALSRVRVIFLRFSCNIHNVVRKHGGGGHFTIVFCLCSELYYFMTNCWLNPAFSYTCWVKYGTHTKGQRCKRRYKVTIVWKAKIRSKTQKHSAQISCSADLLLLLLLLLLLWMCLWEERSEDLLKPG